MARDDRTQIPKMKADDLYREDVFTDRHVGTIRRLTPVTPDGATDSKRAVTFVGSTQLLTSAGPLPLSFEIPGKTLSEAVEGFSAAAEEAVRDTLEELAAIRREAASGLVIPDAGTMGALGQGGLGGPGGGLAGPGGGKLRLP
jgi:hypothetical protein